MCMYIDRCSMHMLVNHFILLKLFIFNIKIQVQLIYVGNYITKIYNRRINQESIKMQDLGQQYFLS